VADSVTLTDPGRETLCQTAAAENRIADLQSRIGRIVVAQLQRPSGEEYGVGLVGSLDGLGLPDRRLVDRSSALVGAGALPGRERLLQSFRRGGGVEAAHQRDLPTRSTIKTLMELLQLLRGDLAHSGGLLIERRYVPKVARSVR